jgi:short-subunit dehydrogenase
VVNVSSVLGHRGVPLKSEYCASKFALHGLSDAVRAELAREKIDVLIVSPSTTATEFFDHALDNPGQEMWVNKQASSSEYVARCAVRAMERGRHEIILTARGKFLVWLDRLCPPLANWLVAKYGQK